MLLIAAVEVERLIERVNQVRSPREDLVVDRLQRSERAVTAALGAAAAHQGEQIGRGVGVEGERDANLVPACARIIADVLARVADVSEQMATIVLLHRRAHLAPQCVVDEAHLALGPPFDVEPSDHDEPDAVLETSEPVGDGVGEAGERRRLGVDRSESDAPVEEVGAQTGEYFELASVELIGVVGGLEFAAPPRGEPAEWLAFVRVI